MINNSVFKEIILSNENFISNDIKKTIPREGLVFPERPNKVNVLYGVRRAGKTFILYQIFLENADTSMYIDFEDERLEGFELTDFDKLKDAFYELKPQHINSKDIIFLFDEIQVVKGWEKFCRRMVEREGIKVFVAGSASEMLPPSIHKALRGRAWSTQIFPFSFHEYILSREIKYSKDELIYGKYKPILKNHFLDYLQWGGFPEVVLLNSEFEKRKVLREYMEAMYFRDLVEKFDIKNIPLLEKLFNVLFSSFSAKFSANSFYRKFDREIPFSKDLLYEYYNHFQSSQLIFPVDIFSNSEFVRARNPNKIYLIDNGLAKRVRSQDRGRLLENTVFLELKRRGKELFYFKNDNECDLVTKRGDNFSVFQVTWELNENNRTREINGLIEACKYLGLNKGTILTYDMEDKINEAGLMIEIQPAWSWFYQRS
ncbi:ATP-binding protein [bacterium]|nr:ATP-binding protein [bacterium]